MSAIAIDSIVHQAATRGGSVDWTQVQALCEGLQTNPEAAETAVAHLLTKIQNPVGAVALSGIYILDACVKACGPPVHTIIGKFKFLNEIVRLVSPQYGAATKDSVRNALIATITRWSVSVIGQPKLHDIVDSWAKKGVSASSEYTPIDLKVACGSAYRVRPVPDTGGHAPTQRKYSTTNEAFDLLGDLGPQVAAAAAPSDRKNHVYQDDDRAFLSAAALRERKYEGDTDSLASEASGWGGGIGADGRATKLQAPSWHEGFLLIGKRETEALLVNYEVGSYLIRESSTDKGSFALAVRDDAGISHFRIDQERGMLYIVGSKHRFKLLQDLVEFYRGPGRDNVLPVKLRSGIYGNYRLYREPVGESTEAGTTRLPAPSEAASEDIAPRRQEKDEWELERKDLVLGSTLGTGNFGEVCLAKLNVPWGGQIDVAVKMAKQDRMTSEMFYAEATKLKQLQHAHIVRVYGLCTTDDPIFIVFEYMNEGSLNTYLRSRKGGRLSLLSMVRILRDVAHGMAFLEHHHWVHADLATRNLLVGADMTVKLCDFGHAMKCDDDDTPVRNPINVPVRWSAPEFFLTSMCNTRADVWSFGVVIFEVLTRGGMPYAEMDDALVGYNNRTLMAMIKSGWRMTRDKKVPSYFYAIMLDCWHEDPILRPTFRKLLDLFRKLGDADRLRVNSSANWGEGLLDGKGNELPPYDPTGPLYTPLLWKEARDAGSKLIQEWDAKAEKKTRQRDSVLLASLKKSNARKKTSTIGKPGVTTSAAQSEKGIGPELLIDLSAPPAEQHMQCFLPEHF
eukprot:m.483255 g.483255  ORF g.483255 m.483255 type:complete len:792 (+) comp21724_c0_seq1:268-2643(+)